MLVSCPVVNSEPFQEHYPVIDLTSETPGVFAQDMAGGSYTWRVCSTSSDAVLPESRFPQSVHWEHLSFACLLQYGGHLEVPARYIRRVFHTSSRSRT
jgi:hypothetical protein